MDMKYRFMRISFRVRWTNLFGLSYNLVCLLANLNSIELEVELCHHGTRTETRAVPRCAAANVAGTLSDFENLVGGRNLFEALNRKSEKRGGHYVSPPETIRRRDVVS